MMAAVRRRRRGAGLTASALTAAVLLVGCSWGDADAGPSGEALGAAVPSMTHQVPSQPPPTSPASTSPAPTSPAPTSAATSEDAVAAPAPAATHEDSTSGPAPQQPALPAPVAPPAGEGNLQPVPTPTRPTLDPVELDEPAEAGDELTVRLVDVEQVQVTGRGPGERSGTALAVEVEVVNDGTTPLDVAGLAVSLAYADTEASPVSAPPADEVVGPVPPRSRVTGTYVFLVPADQRSEVLVRVGLGASQPVVIFEGRVTT